MVSRSRTVTARSASESKSTVTQNGVPISSWRRYRRPMAPASSKSMFQSPRSCSATSRAIGESCSLRDSGSTATFTGARRGSSLSTVRVSVPPFAFGASSSWYASTRNAIIARVRPNDGSITYGTYFSPEAWSK
ncbi:hypothetical protein D3C86_1718660 [compost metagenome]